MALGSKEEDCKFNNSDGKCNIFDSYERISLLKKTELVIELFRIRWGKWTVRIINWGLVVIFIVAIVDYFMSNKSLPIELKIFGALQIWVSFALGIVAMLFSIISMYLSFYNLELQKEAEKKSISTFDSLKDEIVDKIKDEVKKELEEINNNMMEHFNILEKQNEKTHSTLESVSRKTEVNENVENDLKDQFQD